MRRPILSMGCAALLLFAPFAPAQEHEHSHGPSETLGEVHFPTSCGGVEVEFTRAVAAWSPSLTRDAATIVTLRPPPRA